MHLEKRIVDGYVEIVDTRTNNIVARAPLDRSKMESTYDLYEQAVVATRARHEEQRRELAKTLERIWDEPVG
jgi:uncharacterized tellurite resistance protein B-like protein